METSNSNPLSQVNTSLDDKKGRQTPANLNNNDESSLELEESSLTPFLLRI